MNKFLDALKKMDNLTYTENGAGAYKSTTNPMLDAFGSLGAMKDADEDAIIRMFMPAFFEDRAKAMRLLFYMRDIRGGQGMRRVFRVIMHYLANSYPEYIRNNFDNILFFGRGDDLMYLIGTACEKDMLTFVKVTLEDDLRSVQNGGSCSLLAKWLPSENSSSVDSRNLARKIAAFMQLSPREYRKMLSALRKQIDIVETHMSNNEWDAIDFEKLPAKASLIYADAFVKHANDSYFNYLSDVANGKAKVNAKSLFPVDIIKKCYELRYKTNSLANKLLYNAMWENLPNYLEGVDESAICMCDTSGSMSGDPLMVSLSLGIYCADKCAGPFKNHFITFDQNPTLQVLSGDTIMDKVAAIKEINTSNTDFEAALRLILDTAKHFNIEDADVPKKLYVISDMQFDEATGEETHHYWWSQPTKPFTPFMQVMKKEFEDAGYTFPAIVYWNVRSSDKGMFQETVDGENCCMVSGYSPSLFKSVLDGTTYEEVVDETTGQTSVKQTINPLDVMNTTLSAPRYDRVWVG